ncbi:MAG: ionic transporter y4hA [Alphaproteobacteria bacterium]|nr:ionic transporter y4hA [Alphaproteobacteria bacterium]
MTKTNPLLPVWTIVAPAVGWLLLAGGQLHPDAGYTVLLAVGLLGCVIAAVHHAEVVAHRVGEPFGTLVLAGSVTVIEVGLIVALMLAGGAAAGTLARDTVFAAAMIILNGIVGLCLVVGGVCFGEQNFRLSGVNAALATLIAIMVLALVLPNYSTTFPGPVYNRSELGFVSVVSLVLYATFIFVQTVRHRDYFLPPPGDRRDVEHAPPPSGRIAAIGAALLVVCLGAVVILAKAISPAIEAGVARAGAPQALVGVIVAAIVLMPEGWAALRAARADRLQTSLNLALGSALATIGLTIPTVAIVSLLTGWTLTLGIDAKSMVLLLLTFVVSILSLGTGRTTILQGAVHLFIFAIYIFETIVV